MHGHHELLLIGPTTGVPRMLDRVMGNVRHTLSRTSRRTVVSDGRDWTRQSDWTGLLFFVSAVLLSTFILLFLLSSSISLSYFNLAGPMRKCLGKHSCMSSPFPIAILNGTCSLRAPILFCGDVPAIK